MIKLRRFLVPVDFSPPSTYAMTYACDLALALGADLLLLHVYRIPEYITMEAGFLLHESMAVRVKDTIETALSQARQVAMGKDVKTVLTELVEGLPFVEIVRAAKRHESDLIVMGTHGHSGLKHILLGSVAEKVVRKAPCPVLTVRPPNLEFAPP